MKVIINEWVPIGVWEWNGIQEEVCGICRVQFQGTCPECTYPGPDCPPTVGTCSHAFHAHCIEKWLTLDSANNLCPMCRQNWKVSDASSEASGNVIMEDQEGTDSTFSPQNSFA